jgi:hypothetical protein
MSKRSSPSKIKSIGVDLPRPETPALFLRCIDERQESCLDGLQSTFHELGGVTEEVLKAFAKHWGLRPGLRLELRLMA